MSHNGKLLTQIMNNLAKPKKVSIPKNQWQTPGQITDINSQHITMQGVGFDAIGVSPDGTRQYMKNGQDYYFPTKPVREYPLMQRGGQKDSTFENVIEVFDPTGISSWDDVYRSYKETGISPETALEVLGALPLLGKAGKLTKAGIHLAKYQGIDKVLRNILPKSTAVSNSFKASNIVGRTSDAIQAAQQYNQAPMTPFNQGGEMIRRADGSYSPRGLWDNIRANKGSGKKPTKEMLEQEKKIRAKAMYGMQIPAFDKGGPKKPVKKGAAAPQTNPYKDIMSRGADFFRNILPVPDNVAQLFSKQILGDARMSNDSLDDTQKIMLWDVIQNAKKRTGNNNSGTEYQDYGNLGFGSSEDYNNWFNKGKLGMTDLLMKSLSNDGFKLASTIGRGRYWTDEKDPETVYYTDVYDWNSGEKDFKGANQYQNLRNYVRSTEDKNLNSDKNEMFRMNFKLNKKEIDKLRQSQNENKQLNIGMGMFAAGGGVNNPGFKALPQYVQAMILSKMAYGGEDPVPGSVPARPLPPIMKKPLPLGMNFGLNQNDLYALKYNIDATGQTTDGKFGIVDPRQKLSLQLMDGLLGKGRNIDINALKSKDRFNIGLTGATPLFGGRFSLSGNYNNVASSSNPMDEMMPEESAANFMRTPQKKSSLDVNASWQGKPFGKNGPNTKIGFTVGNGGSDAGAMGGLKYGGSAQQAAIAMYMQQGGEPNGEMALGQMAAVSDKMNKLRQFVGAEDNLDPWIASKLAVMDHSADAISDYLMYGPEAQGQEQQMMKGGQTNLPRYQVAGWVQRAANADLNFWEKCGLASSADNGGGGGPWSGGGRESSPQYKNAFASLADIDNDPMFDKDSRSAVRKSRPSGVDKDMWNAISAEASRLNNAYTNKYFWGNNADPATGRLNEKYLADEFKDKINIANYYRYYNNTPIKDKKTVGAQDIYDYYLAQPGGLETFRTMVNSGYKPQQKNGGSTYANGVFYQTGGEAPRMEDYPDYASWRSDFEAYLIAANDSQAAQSSSKSPMSSGVYPSRANENDEYYDENGNYYPGQEAQRYLDALSNSNNPDHLYALDAANAEENSMMVPSIRIVNTPSQSTSKALPGKKATQTSSKKPQTVSNNSNNAIWTQGSNLDEIVIKAKKKPAAASANAGSFYNNGRDLGYGSNKPNAELRQDNKGLSSRAVPGKYDDRYFSKGVTPVNTYNDNQAAFSDAILNFFMKEVPFNVASAAGVGLMGRVAKFLPASKHLPNIVKTRKIASAIDNSRLVGASKAAPKVQQYVPRVAQASANTGKFQYPTYTDNLMRTLENVRWNNSTLADKLSLARNASKIKKAYGGPVVGEEMEVTPEQLEQLRAQGYQFEII